MTDVVSRADINEAHKRFPDDPTARYGYLEGIRKEREACAAVADAHAKNMEDTGMKHPEDSENRARCFARAREAQAIAVGIRLRNEP